LREFYNKNLQLFSQLPIVSRLPQIEIDGMCGRQTKSAISLFQKSMNRQGFPILVDGVVDVTKRGYTPSQQAVYTIWWLNYWFFLKGTGDDSEKRDLEKHSTVRDHAPHLVAELIRNNPNPVRTIY
jgi:hypothetical protein